jgi:hypothetical protein
MVREREREKESEGEREHACSLASIRHARTLSIPHSFSKSESVSMRDFLLIRNVI